MSEQKQSTEQAEGRSKSVDFAKWAGLQLALLQEEQDEGLAQHDLSKLKVTKLQLASLSVGSFGRTVLRLERAKYIVPIPTGTPVKVSCPRWGPGDEAAIPGIVRACDEYEMEVMCKHLRKGIEPTPDTDIVVESVPDKSTIKRVTTALSIFLENPAFSRWKSVLYEENSACRFDSEEVLSKSSSAAQERFKSLNESQRAAASGVVRANDIAIIHGPPGTGKTTTLVTALQMLLEIHPEAKLLCCAPSNVAVDNLVALLSARTNATILRLGHPARVNKQLQRFTLDEILANDTSTAEVLRDVKKELLETRDYARRNALRDEIKARERDAIRVVLNNSKIVLSTLAGAAELKKLLPSHQQRVFTHLIVDEAAQAMESAILVPLTFVNASDGALILAGDHKQLPPTILSTSASKKGLGRTLMERLVDLKPECSFLLQTQYRMHELIMRWSSKEMYEGKLQAAESVASRTLNDLLPNVTDTDVLDPLVFIDTAGCDLDEKVADSDEAESHSNEGEGALIKQHLVRLIQLGIVPPQIAVVTPYHAQVELIKGLLDDDNLKSVEVRTVDGFQGQERECVLLSMVRSNPTRTVGFLADERRLNVAVTRAKRHVFMVGDSATLQSNAFLSRLIQHFEDHGMVRSAAEFLPSDFAAQTSQPSSKQKAGKAEAAVNQKATTKNISKPAGKPTSAAPVQVKAPKASTAVSTPSKSKAAHVVERSAKTFASVQESVVKPAFKGLGGDVESDEEAVEAPETVAAETAQPEMKAVNTASVTKKSKSKGAKKSGAKHSGSADNKMDEEEDDDMAFLEQEAYAATRCGSYPKCTKSIELIYSTCQFCKRRHCLEHCQPEKHGCGGAAKSKALQEKRDHLSGKTPLSKSHMRPTERARVEARLQEKLKAQEESRSAKAPVKKKG